MKIDSKNKNLALIPLLWAFIFLLPGFKASAQSDILNRKLTADFNNIRLNDAFRIIEKQLSIFFTFDGSLINTNRTVNKSFNAVPLKTCLDELLQDSTLTFKVIENHVIIRNKSFYLSVDTIKPVKHPILIIKGRIIDKINRDPLAYASISVMGTGFGVVSNKEGDFILKIPTSYQDSSLCISYLGYYNAYAILRNLSDTFHIFKLDRNYISIQEVIIRKTDPKNILRNALKKIKENYHTKPAYLTAFYCESVNKSNSFMFYSEAVMQIYKSSYSSNFDDDMIKILKARKMQDLSMEDTVIVKLQSGLQASLGLDIIKNRIEFLDEEYFNLYKYSMTDIISLNNKDAYVIEFEPMEFAEDALFNGKIYIDIKELTILSCEFKIDPKRISQNQGQYVVRKNKGIKLKISNITYSVNYRSINNKYYLNHAKGEIDMKIRKQGKLFSFNFDVLFELSVNEIDTINVDRFKRKEAARLHTIFFDEIFAYDEMFWENYNYIKPDESLQQSIIKEKQKTN